MAGLDHIAKSAANRVLAKLGYRAVRVDAFPQASVFSFCANLARRGFRPDHIMDVGANSGDWSRQARAAFPDAMFTLIEPQEEMRPDLERFCQQTPRARWIAVGASDTDGEEALAVAPDTVSSSFRVDDEEAKTFGWSKRSIPVRTLDGICSEIGSIPQIVKLDVEGYEDKVLDGARSLIGVTEIFLVELTLFAPRTGAMSFEQAVARMAELGYVAYDFSGFQRRPYDGALGICEAAFVLLDGQLRSHQGWY